MKSTDKSRLTIVQMNDTHAYLDIHLNDNEDEVTRRYVTALKLLNIR